MKLDSLGWKGYLDSGDFLDCEGCGGCLDCEGLKDLQGIVMGARLDPM